MLIRRKTLPDSYDTTHAPAPFPKVSRDSKFDLEGDRWNLHHLLRPHQPKCEGVANFKEIPEWLRGDAKDYVKHLIEDAATEVRKIPVLLVSLRHMGRFLPDFKGRPIDLSLKHAREAARRFRELDLTLTYKHRIKREINQFMSFIRQKNPEVRDNNFQIVLPRQNTKDTDYKRQGEIVDTEIQAKIINACLLDLQKYRVAKSTYIYSLEHRTECERRRKQRLRKYPPGEAPKLLHETLNDLHRRAIKGQAVILEICVGRRPAAVCDLPLDVKVEKGEWTNEVGQTERGVSIRFIENKVTRAYEDVFCPDAFGELALKAVETTKELTEDLRRDNPHLAEHLFLVPSMAVKEALVLSPQQMNTYLNGCHRFKNGLIRRHDIPCGRVTMGAFRRTRATKAWMGGMQVHDVAADMGHFKIDTTIRHYIVGNEESRRRYKTLMEHGALEGALLDFIGGVEVVNIKLGRRQVEMMAGQGRVVVPNRYGYCALAGSGHCVRTTPCYLGETVESEGCNYHLLSPDALPALEEDRETLEASIEINNGDQWCGQLVQSMRNQLEVVNHKIEHATNLRKKLDVAA
jgi:hypothetical protein